MTRKIALITGGGRGLGRSTALHLADKNVDIILTYLSNQTAAEAVVTDIQARGSRAIALQLDTGNTSRFPEFAKSLASVLTQTWQRNTFDFLINNAGIGISKPFSDTSEDEFDTLMNMHFKGVYFLTQRLLHQIEDGGRIVNLSTGLARFTMPGFSAYGAMKGAVEVLTRYMANELGPRGISVNAIAPGAIETDFGGGVVRDDPQVNELVASLTAMGRVGLPEDVGGAITSLLVGDNQWMTGQRIEVSGGQSL